MRAVSALLLVVAALVAGCSLPEDRESVLDDDASGTTGDAGEGSCETRFGGELAPVASLVPTLQDDPDVAMRRLAEVVNDTPRDTPVVQGSQMVWTTERGMLRWERDGNASVRVSYEGPMPGEPRALVEAALASFQPPFDLVHTPDGAQALQKIGRYAIEGTGAAVANGTLTVGTLLQLDPHVVVADEATLLARAREVAQCVDPDARTDGGILLSYRLRDEVLVQRVEVPTGPEGCGAEVHVDLHAIDGTLAPPILCLAHQGPA